MKEIDPQLGVILFLITFAMGRLLARRSLAYLDATPKVQLVDGAALPRIIAPVILLVLVGIYFVGLKKWPDYATGLQMGVFGVTLLLVLGAVVLAQFRIRRLNLPAPYLRLISISQAVQVVGAAVLLASLVAT